MNSRRALFAAMATLTLVLGGCAMPRPEPAPLPLPVPVPVEVAPAPVPAPLEPEPVAPSPPPDLQAARPAAPERAAVVVDLGPPVALPPANPARTWDEFKRLAARRLVAANPKATYMGKPPPILFGIPVLEVELNGDGSVRQINITRPPSNIDAQYTIDYAMEAVRRGAPYGDMSRLPKPWKWTEVFLFTEKRQFKPRTLD
jgi:hypothetical protein